MSAWLSAFGLTLLVEMPVWWLLLRGPVGSRGALLTGLAVNVITQPLLWLLWHVPGLDTEAYWTLFAASELLAMGAEAVLATWLAPRLAGRAAVPQARTRAEARRSRRRLPLTDAALTAIVANCFSMAASLFVAMQQST